MAILQDQTHTQEQVMSNELLKAEIARLKAENSKLKDKGSTIKASEKGAVSVYGLGRFPVTLYPNQFRKLLAMADKIETFILEDETSEHPRLSYSKD